MLFVPTYQIQLTAEMRDQIGQEQRTWQDYEIACFVYGYQDLATPIKLRDDTVCTIRNLLFRLPNSPQSIRRTMFHGVDRRAEKAWCLKLLSS